MDNDQLSKQPQSDQALKPVGDNQMTALKQRKYCKSNTFTPKHLTRYKMNFGRLQGTLR